VPQRHLARARGSRAVEGAVHLGARPRGARRFPRDARPAAAEICRPGASASGAAPRTRRARRARDEGRVISEPVTLATDYLLAAAAALMALRVLRTAGGQDARRWWGVAFIALALGAALGGTHHGF